MKVLITGERGFIAENLRRVMVDRGHDVVEISSGIIRVPGTGEACVYRNDIEIWIDRLRSLDVDVVIHNAAIVGTDVVALNPDEATSTNVTGTYRS